MQARYLRNLPALTEAECQALKHKRVLIAGCGGIGGYLLELLLRIGVGTIRVCDGDVFEESNLNRQLLAQAGTLGTGKAQAAALRGRQVNPEVQVEVWEENMGQSNVGELIRDCQVVLDGLDNVQSRRILCAACAREGKPYVFGAVSGWVAQAAVSMPGDHLVETLYPRGSAVEDKSVLSFTPALCAAIQASLCVKLLLSRPVQTGKLYHFDLLNQEFETIPLG